MSTNAFDVLMRKATPVCPPDDPWYTAVIYEAHLEHVDESEPLFRVPYFGQVVRAGTAKENFEDRKRHHEYGSIRDPKDLGFHAVIGMYGADKIEWRIVSSKAGRRSEVQAWANGEEVRLIAEHGGVLRDMDAGLEQTLNLTKGGQGDPAAVWAGIECRRRRVLTKFKAAMEAYVEEYGSALVPLTYVDEDGYKLGSQSASFRRGHLRKGMSDEADINAWAEALPKWAWNAQNTDEFREGRVQRSKDWWTNATEEQVAEWHKAVSDANKRPEVRAKRVQAGKDMWTNATEQQRTAWSKAKSDAHNRPEVRAKRVQSGKDMWANATEQKRTAWSKAISDAQNRPEVRAKRVQASKDKAANETAEQKANRIAKQRATIATDAFRAKRSKITKDRYATERRAELERARAIAVPFQKSLRRRAELRAASTDFSGRKGNAVLYMISNDGKTIQKVQKNGGIGEKYIVGPVVDPAPPNAFDSD